MSLWSLLFGKKKVRRWRGKPLYRKGKTIYWKDMPVHDDEFESVRENPAELRQYNYWVRKLNRRLRRRR